MTPTLKTVLALLALCMSVVVGTSFAHTTRTSRHYYRLLHAARNGNPDIVVSEYLSLPRDYRKIPLVDSYYREARAKARTVAKPGFFPAAERADFISLGIYAVGLFLFWQWVRPKERKLYSRDVAKVRPDPPTQGQLAFIRRINQGVVPLGLTKASAAQMIKAHIVKVGTTNMRQRIDVSPLEFMSASRRERELRKLERERRRAREKVERQAAIESRRRAREAEKAERAEERRQERRYAEERRLRETMNSTDGGCVRRGRTQKARTIQEFQELVGGIISDNVIEPQEARQLKAWLVANRRTPGDFSQMLKIIDDSLVDGIIDADETQAIYEGIIDCLVTLRDR